MLGAAHLDDLYRTGHTVIAHEIVHEDDTTCSELFGAVCVWISQF